MIDTMKPLDILPWEEETRRLGMIARSELVKRFNIVQLLYKILPRSPSNEQSKDSLGVDWPKSAEVSRNYSDL